MSFLIRLLLNGCAIVVAAWMLPGLHLSGASAALIAGAMLGLVNALVRPVLLFFTFPLTIVTLGVFLERAAESTRKHLAHHGEVVAGAAERLVDVRTAIGEVVAVPTQDCVPSGGTIIGYIAVVVGSEIVVTSENKKQKQRQTQK